MKTRKNGRALLTVLGLMASVFGPGDASAETSIEVKNCKIRFATVGQPVLVQIEGSSGAPCTGKLVASDDGKLSGKITMPVTELDTGIPLRNKHLRENYLKTEQFPNSEVSEIRAEGFAEQLASLSGKSSPFAAKLTLHGVTAEVMEGTYRLSRKGKDRELRATFKIDLPQFGVDRPSFMGVQVVDAVNIDVEFVF